MEGERERVRVRETEEDREELPGEELDGDRMRERWGRERETEKKGER